MACSRDVALACSTQQEHHFARYEPIVHDIRETSILTNKITAK